MKTSKTRFFKLLRKAALQNDQPTLNSSLKFLKMNYGLMVEASISTLRTFSLGAQTAKPRTAFGWRGRIAK